MEGSFTTSSGHQVAEAPDLNPSHDDDSHAGLEPPRRPNPKTMKRARRRLRLWEKESYADHVLCEENLDEQLIAHRVLDRYPAQVIHMLMKRPRDFEALKCVLHEALRRGDLDTWPLVSYAVQTEQLERLAPVRVQTLARLDDTTVVNIFANLPLYDICGVAPTGLAAVCRHWERLSRDPGLWKALSFTRNGMPNESYRTEFAWMLLQKSSMAIQRFADARLRQLRIMEFTINEGKSRRDLHPDPSRWWANAVRTILEASDELRVLRITIEAEKCGGFERLFRLGSSGGSVRRWHQPTIDSNDPGEFHPRVQGNLFDDATRDEWGAIRQSFDSLETLHLALDNWFCRLLPSLPSLKSLHLLNAGSICFHQETMGYVPRGEETPQQDLCSRHYPSVTDLVLHYQNDGPDAFSLARHDLNGIFIPSNLDSLALFNVPFSHLWSWLGCATSGSKLPLRRLTLSHAEEPLVRGLNCLPNLIELKLFSLLSDHCQVLIEALSQRAPQIRQVDLGSEYAPVPSNIALQLAEEVKFPCLQESTCFIFSESRPLGEAGGALPPERDFRMRALRHRINRTRCFWSLNYQFGFYETHFHAQLPKLKIMVRAEDAPEIKITGKNAWVIDGLHLEIRYDHAREDLETLWESLPAEIRSAYTTQIAPAMSEAAAYSAEAHAC